MTQTYTGEVDRAFPAVRMASTKCGKFPEDLREARSSTVRSRQTGVRQRAPGVIPGTMIAMWVTQEDRLQRPLQ